MFNHLHLHTDGSVLDGGARISNVVKKAIAQGSNAVAITDHGSMIKCYEFYKECKANNIKPIIGCEFYMGEPESKDRHHLILLAKNNEGLKNLYKLNAYAYTKNFYYKPRIDMEHLIKYHNGLICTSACIGSEFGSMFVDHKSKEEIASLAIKYYELFGKDFYFEIQPNGIPAQTDYNNTLVDLSLHLNIPLTVSCDVHYVEKEDYNAHDTMLAMQVKKKKQDTDRFRFTCNDFYMKTEQEVREGLYYLPEDIVQDAIDNTVAISNKCEDVTIEYNPNLLPYICDNPELELAKQCNEGLKERIKERAYIGIDIKDVIARISYELHIIKQKGYCGYFLIVQDFLRFAKSKGIFVGAGRGSCCGSEVAFIIGITEVEPIKYGLLFERFLNPERNSPPDIDSDIQYDRREEVANYIKNKYGSDNVAKIIAEGTFAPNAVVRKVLSTYDVDQKLINIICKTIHGYEFRNKTLKDAYNEITEFKNYMDRFPDAYQDMLKLEGLMSHISTHAAGIVISPVPISDIVPCMSDSENRSMLITQWHKKIVEATGLYKFDLLGLKTLSIMSNTIDNIKKNRNVTITKQMLDNVNTNDPELYRTINSGDLAGIFEFDAPAGKMTIQKIHPDNFNDIIAAEALCRPGVKEADMYIENKRNNSYTPTGFPKVDAILRPTYGAIVYQEQTMLLMHEIAGWSLGKADKMRKVKSLEEYKEEFVQDGFSRGYSNDFCNSIYDRFSLEYSFNKSHAAAYGIDTMGTDFLKTYYRVEFMASVMSMDLMCGGDNIKQYTKECQKYGITMLAPDINKSTMLFEVEGNSIRFPLTLMQNVGEKAVVEIVMKRPFDSLLDMVSKVPKSKVNKRCITNLIKAGCFDNIETSNRSLLLNQYRNYIKDNTTVEPTWCRELCMMYEKEVIGMYITYNPLDGFISKRFADMKDNDSQSIYGIINEVKTNYDKNNKLMAFVKIENKTDMIDCLVFSGIYKKLKDILKENMKARFIGKKSGDRFIIDGMEVI